MGSRKNPGRRVRAACVVGALTLAAVASGTPAYAGASCGITGCSSEVNDSAYSATALKNWCTSGGGTGDLTGTKPTCTVDNVQQTTYFLSSGGGHTPYKEDWDVLQIDAGWCYKVHFIVDFGSDFTKTYDRRGTSAGYVKVSDNADAHVQGQSTSGCP